MSDCKRFNRVKLTKYLIVISYRRLIGTVFSLTCSVSVCYHKVSLFIFLFI